MANPCIRHNCPDCGDEFVHQNNRRGNESSSGYGQHIYDSYPKDFYYADVDGVIYKLATGIMRIVEHKPIGADLKPSQRAILPMLAASVDVLADVQVLNADSGVFVINSDWPYVKSHVRRFRRDGRGVWLPGRADESLELSGEELKNFETGLPVNRLGLIGRAVP